MHCIDDVRLILDILHSVRSKVHSTGAIMHCIHSKILYLYISAIVHYLVQHVHTLCIISIVIALLLVLTLQCSHQCSNINLLKTLFTKGVLRLHSAMLSGSLEDTFRTTKCASGRSFWLRQGAQGVTIFVRPSVRSSGPSLSRAPNLHLSGFGLYQVTLRALLGLS